MSFAKYVDELKRNNLKAMIEDYHPEYLDWSMNYAVRFNKHKQVEFFVSQGAKITPYLLEAALVFGFHKVLIFLLAHVSNKERVFADHALVYCAQKRHWNIIRRLACEGVIKEDQYGLILIEAFRDGNVYDSAFFCCITRKVNYDFFPLEFKIAVENNIAEQVKAANIIQHWWIHIVYDYKRPCGRRMAEKNYQNFCDLYDEKLSFKL